MMHIHEYPLNWNLFYNILNYTIIQFSQIYQLICFTTEIQYIIDDIICDPYIEILNEVKTYFAYEPVAVN